MILKPRNVDGLNKEVDVETSKNKTSGKREEPARNWKARQHTPAKWRLRKQLEKNSQPCPMIMKVRQAEDGTPIWSAPLT